MLFLNKADVAHLATMKDAIPAVEKAFLKHAKGKTVYPPKSQFNLPTKEWKWWGFMPVYVEDMGVACKVVSDYPENKRQGRPTITATTVLCDVETGEVKAIMDSTQLTAIRTGALCAIAAKKMARGDSKTVGIIGCGVQARSQLEGLSQVFKIEKAKIYDVNELAMADFVYDMGKLDIRIERSDPRGVQDADIVVASTVSKTPVVLGAEIKPGTHVTSIGAHTMDARELDDAFMKAAKIAIDSQDAMKSGDFKGYTERPIEIKEVIAGAKVRQKKEDITLFKSVGTALQDVAMANLVYEKARKACIGQWLNV